MKKVSIILYSLLFTHFCLFASGYEFHGMYPSHWWVGMKNNKLQLIIHSDDIRNSEIKVSYPGVSLIKINNIENKNYVILDLIISSQTKPGKFKIHIKNPGYEGDIEYELKPRSKENGKTRVQGVTSSDFIYLLMPDRFSNGDPSNDFFPDMRDTGHDRNNPFDRHGGDLQGVTNHLDYLKGLGVTAIWMTPVNENDMSRTLEGGTQRSTYHGYAFTDQYTVDRRFGGNEAYKKLIDEAHRKGMKIIQDAVYNHIGNDHWLFHDLPAKDWLNQWPTYTNTSYKDQPLFDPHTSAIDKKITVDGWFTPFLADLNQRNPFVSNFLIQYAVWATEEFGIDGWRVDTYFYNDPAFLNKINDALLKEFPALTIFGETSVNSVVNGAYFSQNNMTVPFKHNLQGITDFPLFYATVDAANQPEGVDRLYSTLTQDILYKNPSRNCIFLDNHDQDRFYSVVKEDFDKFRMGINWLMTLRGIPQLYYGTEILMKNVRNPTDAEVRKDFPGGWPGDAANKFEAAGRTAQENETFNLVKALADFRKKSSAVKTGKLMQYVPKNGLYIYFRYDIRQTVMVIANTGKTAFTPDWSFYRERTAGFSKMKNVTTGEVQPLNGYSIQPKESFVFELLK